MDIKTIIKEEEEKLQVEIMEDYLQDCRFGERLVFPDDKAIHLEKMRGHYKKLLNWHTQSLIKVLEGLREEIGESHGLETYYKNPDCGLNDHVAFWGGNYYTCQFCGEEFTIKQHTIDTITRVIEELKEYESNTFS